ncbi:MAG: aldose 1-epimerase family protein [Phreatobacter sp.]|nr:aldose 1-epimerase family protein [Phreatobacter sp.]
MIELESGDYSAAVSPFGAELRSWRAGGHELLWQGDPGWWAQSAPVLFPIVGWARDGLVRIDGIARPMGVHGFAAQGAFAIDTVARDHVRLTLRETGASLAAYPFPFRLTLEYRLAHESLAATVEVENTGARTMPFAVGLHPGFNWPLAGGQRESHATVFEAAEASDVPVIAPGGLFSSARRPVPLVDRRLPLNDKTFAAEALCFLNARSRSVRYEAGPRDPAVTLAATGFPHWAIWSKPGAPFVSIEAWTGHGDPEGFEGELKDKPSMRLLASGASDRCSLVMSYSANREP